MAELGVAGTAVGVVSLGIQVCQGLVKYYGSWKDAPKDVAQMCSSVRSLEETLKLLGVTIKDNGAATQVEAGVQNNINACLISINELGVELVKVQEVNGSSVWSKVHGQGRRLLYPFRESTLLKLKAIVAEVRENLSLVVDVLNLTTNSAEDIDHMSAQVDDLVLTIRSHQNDENSKAIMNWISPLNFSATQADTLRRRQEGTGEWLFKTIEFEAWLAGTNRILWCSGLPGAGKTILASAIVDKFQTKLTSHNVGLAFVYCNYKERDSQTLANLLGSLIKQLVQYRGTIPETVLALFKKPGSENIQPSEGELLTIFRSILAEFSHVYVVVDALDECNSETRNKLIDILKESPVNLHLLCTSRHLGDIQEAFADGSHLDIRASDEDVALYLEAQILQVPKLLKYCNKVRNLQRSIVEKVVEKAKGMFLLAALHLESLKSKTDIKSLRKALDFLPDGRDNTYDEALERIQKQPEDESKLAMRILSWIIHATRPLKVGEIQHAIAVMNFEPDDTTIDEEGLTDEAELITACGGIVVIDESSRVIRLVHYTTQEYFERHRSKIFPTAEVDILRVCIRYLSMEPFNYGPCPTNSKLEKRLKNFELIEYASQNWGTHAGGDLDDEIIKQVLSFLDDQSLLSSAIQVMYFVASFRDHPFSSQDYPEEVPGLVVAAEFGLTRFVGEMLRMGNKIDGNGSDGMRPLHVAAKQGHHALVQLLLQEGADIKARDEEEETALHLAAYRGHQVVVKLLLQEGADIEARNEEEETALHIAVYRGHRVVVQLLLQEGADIQAKDKKGSTALHLALQNREETIVRLLLQEGANVEAKDKYGHTSLHLAASAGAEATTLLLLQEGARMEARTKDGQTALHLAAANGDEAIVQLLLQKGADVKVEGQYRETALHLAAESGSIAVVWLLLQEGADIEAEDRFRQTALHQAAKGSHGALVRLLIQEGANIKAEDHFRYTALHHAAESNAEAIVWLLLRDRADIEAKSQSGQTALHRAAIYGNEAIIILLLQEGADMEAVDMHGQTAKQIARMFRHEHVVELLTASS